jgi:hypothetical protein
MLEKKHFCLRKEGWLVCAVQSAALGGAPGKAECVPPAPKKDLITLELTAMFDWRFLKGQ